MSPHDVRLVGLRIFYFFRFSLSTVCGHCYRQFAIARQICEKSRRFSKVPHNPRDYVTKIRHDVFREETQNEIALGLEQLVLATIPAIGVLVVEMQIPVHLHGESAGPRKKIAAVVTYYGISKLQQKVSNFYSKSTMSGRGSTGGKAS